jgi:putative ABC transport system substrate-binding protein
MNNRRKLVISLVAGALGAPLASFAQQEPGKIPRIGYLSARVKPTPNIPAPPEEAFQQGLRDLGYVVGKNILIEYRYAEGMAERYTGYAAELVKLKVDVLVSPTGQGIRAAKQATTTIPIVMAIQEDPVAAGLVNSMARPGGNITGLTRLTHDLSGKRLELLKEVVSGASRIGVIWDAGSTGTSPFNSYEPAARALRVELQSLELRGPRPDLEHAFRTAAKARVNALITGGGGLTANHRKSIADLAIKYRIPSMCARGEYVEAGCLMSYSADDAESYRRSATYVDKILKGAKPADLPIEQPTKFEFIINLKTARQIGLKIPAKVLARADKVIK